MANQIYLIVDFSASKTFTHHWKSIEVFENFLSEKKSDISIFIPSYADTRLFSNLNNVKRILISPDFGPSKEEKLTLYAWNKILKITLDNLSNFLSEKKMKNIRTFFIDFYVRNIFKKILELEDKYEKINILLPSAEPMSIRLMENLGIGLKGNLHWKIRLIGSQERGLLSNRNETERVRKFAETNMDNVKIGYETFPYKDYLLGKGFNQKFLHWSPFPASYESHKKSAKTNLTTLGFLGSAKERKGFEAIPVIYSKLEKSKLKFNFLVQKAAYPWQSYEETLTTLESLSRITFLDGQIEASEISSAIRQCDLIVLPYDSESYALAASAILYQAADNGIPVICSEGVGFAKEVSTYGIGEVIKNFPFFLVL